MSNGTPQGTDPDHTFEVIVIGLGPGGEHVAGTLAERGLRVLALDDRLVGGECPYWGCIPSKMMVRAADALAEARRVGDLAGTVGEVTPDWSVVAKRIRDEATDDWDDKVAVDRLVGKGATFVRGRGVIAGPGRVAVDGTTYTATTGIVVGTGTTAAIPPIEGLADTPYWTNHEIVEATELPASIIVLGGGAIGCELSQVMARFTAERLLVATGRRADLRAVGLHRVGVAEDARTVPVDDHCRVTGGVWALGDITGRGAFTHVSMYQAGIVIRDVLGDGGPSASYAALPRVTFTDPEVGSVGLTEKQARDQLAHVQVGVTPLGETTRGWIAKADGFIKLVADGDRGVLVGATTMSPAGG